VEQIVSVAVVIPVFRCKAQIRPVIDAIGPEVSRIYVVDDACPEGTGRAVEESVRDPRVRVIYHAENRGVGGAVTTGYAQAVEDGASIVVKVDGDGQMSPALIPSLIRPIQSGLADYAKGNRFYLLRSLSEMPPVRLFGNSVLSFVNKIVHGYWNIMDPTNGFTAIHASAVRALPLASLSRRYFFESDMLFRLSTIRAVVVDVPMKAKYADEKSGLSVSKVVLEFPPKYASRFFKRIFYNYFLRDFNAGSVQLVLGTLLFVGGTIFGASEWYLHARAGAFASAGTVMLATLPIILGAQLLLAFIQFDTLNLPLKPIQSFDRES
jgi:glycosyltransferase involved in cell wall biosynthesis